jgi:hypothetical protein
VVAFLILKGFENAVVTLNGKKTNQCSGRLNNYPGQPKKIHVNTKHVPFAIFRYKDKYFTASFQYFWNLKGFQSKPIIETYHVFAADF